MPRPELLLRDVEVDGVRLDVRLRAGRIAEVGERLPVGDDVLLRGDAAALLPGLHDHHLHLLATAAAASSVPAGPPTVRTAAQLHQHLATARPVHGWVRAVGYDESVAGELDRTRLDALHADRPVRLQHRSGALWVLNSAGVVALGLDDANDTPRLAGIERDAAGRATGRLWRLDRWLRHRLGDAGSDPGPDLAAVGARLTRYGITGVTDATPELGTAGLQKLSDAHAAGQLPQHIVVLAADLNPAQIAAAGLQPGPAKIVISDHALPGLHELTDAIRRARAQGRAVAMHAVTREALLLAVAALDDVGARTGDRIEHAAVTPPETVPHLVRLGLRVVTQPSLVAQRGGDYLDRVEGDDRRYLWPFARLRAAGVPVAASSDAPHGDLDPWAGIRAARDRRAEDGRVVVAGERVPAAVALAAYHGAPGAPGGPARRVQVGAPADLVLLDAPLRSVLADPVASRVRTTILGGRVAWSAEPAAAVPVS